MAIRAATSLLVVEGAHRDRAPPHDLGDGLLQLGHHQVAQGDGAQQAARRRLHHVAGVDGLLVPGHRAHVLQRLSHLHRGIEAHELGGHERARRALGIAQEALELGPGLRAELGQATPPRDLVHRGGRSRPAGRRRGPPGSGPTAWARASRRWLRAGGGWAGPAPRPRGQGQHGEDGGRFLQGQLVDQLREVGRGKVRHRLPDPHEALVEAQPDAFQQVLVLRHDASPDGRRPGWGPPGAKDYTRPASRARVAASAAPAVRSKAL